MYGHQIDQVKHILSLSMAILASFFATHAVGICLYLGLFTAPLLLVCVAHDHATAKMAEAEKSASAIARALFGTTLLVGIVLGLPTWPLFGNLLGLYGIGPFLQHGASGHEWGFLFGVIVFWTLVGILSVGFAGLMFYCLVKATRGAWRARRTGHLFRVRALVFLCGTTLIYLIPVLGVGLVFDRYLLLPILTLSLSVLLAVEWSPASRKSPRAVAAVATLMIAFAGVLTTMATHDYLAWNRARWAAIDRLLHTENISPSRIDGGFEFNGMYLYSKEQTRIGLKGWWVVDNEYLIAYSANPTLSAEGYKVQARYPVDTFLPTSPQNIFVLRKH